MRRPFIVAPDATGSLASNNMSSPNDEEEKEVKDDADDDAVIVWNAKLKSILDSTQNCGEFCVTQRIDVPALHPKIQIEGMEERLAYPLTSRQAKEIIEIAKSKSNGKLKVDSNEEASKQPWNIDPSLVSFCDSDKWNAVLASIVRCMATKMGVTATVKLLFHGMVLAEAGSKVEDVTSPEGQAGVFGVLEIQLPSSYQGGDVAVSYKGEPEVTTKDHVNESQDSYFALSFLDDCEQSAESVTAGCRLSLVYYLQLDARAQVPTVENIYQNRLALRDLVSSWEDGAVRGYLLAQGYPGDLNSVWFTDLVGHDEQLVRFLQSMTDAAGNPLFKIHLALLEKWESVTIPADSNTIDEVLDSETTVRAVIDSDGNIFKDITMLPFDIDWDLFHDCEEVDEIFGDEAHEGIRREGDIHEFTYFRVAVLFWPQSIAGTVAFDAASSSKRLAPEIVNGKVVKRARVELVDDSKGAGHEDDPIVLDDDDEEE